MAKSRRVPVSVPVVNQPPTIWPAGVAAAPVTCTMLLRALGCVVWAVAVTVAVEARDRPASVSVWVLPADWS